MSVEGQGQMQKKMLNFTLHQFFVAWKKSVCYPFDSHKILQFHVYTSA